MIYTPGPDFVERALVPSGRPTSTLCGLQRLFSAGALAGSGYLSIMDAGHLDGRPIHSVFRDPEVVAAAAERIGCSALEADSGFLAVVARRFAHRTPMLLAVEEALAAKHNIAIAKELGCVGVSLDLDSDHGQTGRCSELIAEARAAGLVTMAKCATPTPAAVASLTRSDPDLASFSRMPGASASTHRIDDIRAVIASLRFGRIGCVWQMEATVPIAARAVDNDLAEVKRRWHGILDRAMDHRTTGASG